MINQAEAGCDLLVISPHTDDAEIGVGGMICQLARQGRRVWVLDLTRGELGSNATPDIRWAEGENASAVLGLTGRIQLELPDGFVDAANQEHVAQVVAVLRSLRPRWVVTAPDPVRHPDHVATPPLVRKAVFMARLGQWQPQLAGHRVWAGGAQLPKAVERWETESVFGVCADDEKPAAIFDVSDVWAEKQKALACYASQFGRGDGQVATTINAPEFMERIERRAKTWGRRAGTQWAEALSSQAVPVLNDTTPERWRG